MGDNMGKKRAVLVRGRCQQGQRERVREAFERHLAPRAQSNAAQQIVVWCADQADPDVFHLFEVYADEAAMDANARSEWFAIYMQEVAPLLAGQPEVSLAYPEWQKS